MIKCVPRIHIGVNTLLLFVFLLVFDRSIIILVPLAAALLHELGHISVMLLCGVGVRRIDVTLFGAEISGGCLENVGKAARIAIYSAGAAVNLLSGCIGELLGLRFFADCSFALAAVNLLPVRTLDGGCILNTIFEDVRCGQFIIELLSALSLFMLWLAAAYLLLLCEGNLSLMAFIAYLFVTMYLD